MNQRFQKYILLLLFFASVCSLHAQTVIEGTQKASLMKNITEKTLGIKTLQRHFTQTKVSSLLANPVVAKGEMTYKSPQTLRWEYLTPNQFLFVLQGDSVITQSSKGKSVSNVKDNRMMKGISSMIMGCVSGKKLFDEKLFSVTMLDEGGSYVAQMTPKRKDMRRMFNQITFKFDKKSYVINAIVINERSGDTTTIVFN